MWIARRRGASLPPISVYRLGGRHFVIDGHHRVSVERSFGATCIAADVIELLPVRASPRSPRLAEPLRGPVTPGWQVVALFLSIALALTLLAGAFAPVPGYLLILVACASIGRGLGIPAQTGLEDHRQ